MIGETVAQYRIDEEIGRGGMGIVYRARDLKLERDVALKLVSPELTADPGFRDRLVREARAAASLSHPAISVIYAVEEVEGKTFIAMELIRGKPLAAVLASEALEPVRCLNLAIEVAEALAEGHARAVVHRDLKPGNVMVSDSGHAKIIDFGLAEQARPRGPLDSGIDTPARAQDEGQLVGTAAYMSPEQVTGTATDQRTDIFSFASLLYEALAGHPAYLRASAVETLHAVLKDAPPQLPQESFGDAGSELQRILNKCWQKDPEDRYPAAQDLIVDLRAARRCLTAPVAASAAQSTATGRRREGLGVIIVDDEEPARLILKEYLAAESDAVLLAECRNGFEAVKAVSELEPDVVFLDVQMPKLDGFEVVELIGPGPTVVFVTAFDEHALRAFEVNALDYLLKPVAPERFSAALARARARIGQPQPAIQEIVAEARPERKSLERILIKQGADVVVLPVVDVDYVEAQDDYVSIHSGGREWLKQQRMAALESALDASIFVRIHRSYLLNLDRLSKLEADGKDSRVAILKDGTRLPVSRTGHGKLKELL